MVGVVVFGRRQVEGDQNMCLPVCWVSVNVLRDWRDKDWGGICHVCDYVMELSQLSCI